MASTHNPMRYGSFTKRTRSLRCVFLVAADRLDDVVNRPKHHRGRLDDRCDTRIANGGGGLVQAFDRRVEPDNPNSQRLGRVRLVRLVGPNGRHGSRACGREQRRDRG